MEEVRDPRGGTRGVRMFSFNNRSANDGLGGLAADIIRTMSTIASSHGMDVRKLSSKQLQTSFSFSTAAMPPVLFPLVRSMVLRKPCVPVALKPLLPYLVPILSPRP